MAYRRSSHGFTVLEMLVATVVLVVISVAVLQFNFAARHAERQERVSIQAQQQSRLAMDAISEDLRLASAVTLSPNSPLGMQALRFRTVAWNVPNPGPNLSPWIEYRLNPNDPTILERVDYCVGCAAAPGNEVLTRRIASGLFPANEDANNNGVLDPGEDLNGDGRLERGLWFTVLNEDQNDNGILEPLEDDNGNGRIDAVVTVQVDTQVLGRENARGSSTVAGRIRVRNE